jgi:hypothetical protein
MFLTSCCLLFYSQRLSGINANDRIIGVAVKFGRTEIANPPTGNNNGDVPFQPLQPDGTPGAVIGIVVSLVIVVAGVVGFLLYRKFYRRVPSAGYDQL